MSMSAHNVQTVSDWLNPFSLGIMSASAYIENLAQSSTCLINYQELTSLDRFFLV